MVRRVRCSSSHAFHQLNPWRTMQSCQLNSWCCRTQWRTSCYPVPMLWKRAPAPPRHNRIQGWNRPNFFSSTLYLKVCVQIQILALEYRQVCFLSFINSKNDNLISRLMRPPIIFAIIFGIKNTPKSRMVKSIPTNIYNSLILQFINKSGVLGFWGFGVLGLGFRV